MYGGDSHRVRMPEPLLNLRDVRFVVESVGGHHCANCLCGRRNAVPSWLVPECPRSTLQRDGALLNSAYLRGAGWGQFKKRAITYDKTRRPAGHTSTRRDRVSGVNYIFQSCSARPDRSKTNDSTLGCVMGEHEVAVLSGLATGKASLVHLFARRLTFLKVSETPSLQCSRPKITTSHNRNGGTRGVRRRESTACRPPSRLRTLSALGFFGRIRAFRSKPTSPLSF
jgi:hypothetical protein